MSHIPFHSIIYNLIMRLILLIFLVVAHGEPLTNSTQVEDLKWLRSSSKKKSGESSHQGRYYLLDD